MHILLFCFIEGTDYDVIEGYPESIFFPVASQKGCKVCTEFEIIDDTSYEKDKHFFVHVESEDNVVIHQNYTRVDIIDDDGILSSVDNKEKRVSNG